MEEKLQTSINNISEQIAELNIDEDSKRNLYHVLKGIIDSPNNRVYVKNTDDYQEYISLKLPKETPTSNYKICIVDRMIDYSGATAGRQYRYPSLEDLSIYVDENQFTINSSLNEIRYQKEIRATEESTQTPNQEIISIIKNKIEKLSVPERYKSRVYILLDNLIEEGSKIYTVEESNYSEYLSIRNQVLSITRKITDYSGATIGRQVFPIKSDDLVIYVEEHKNTIDTNLSQGKKL